MRFSKSFIKTLKETPKEAEIASHKLLLRASMIKKLTSGVYTYLPLGLKALKKVENIVREEMNRAGAQEIFMPVLQPAELWQDSGRYDVMGPLMMKLKDRAKRDFVLGPTHEEVVTDLVKNDISSYKQLPINVYQIQTKFRDEIRPRFGLMRGREFIMKDAYSFHSTRESLDTEFDNMEATYNRIFSRCGLKFRPVEADSGAIGGSGSKEFHVLADSGEDEIIYCESCNYAANVETAISKVHFVNTTEKKELKLVDTPNISKIEDVVKFLNVPIENTVKAMMYKELKTDQVYMALIRGDYEVNETKLVNAVNGIEVELLSDEELEKLGLVKGFIGPVALNNKDIKIVADDSILELTNHTAGGNKIDTHYINVNYGVDYTVDIIKDLKTVRPGHCCAKCGGTLNSARGIEVGHIFKLGDKYTKALGANFIDDKGISNPMIMGCYGIGVSRTMASAIEQNNDEFGIVWPSTIAPYVVDVIPVNIKDDAQVALAEELYKELLENNIDSMIDDRDEKPGFKFKDADLIGFPFKVVCGKKAQEKIVELKIRKTGESFEIPQTEVLTKIKELMKVY